jgi:hypothetical protein
LDPHRKLLRRDRAGAADGEPGPGKRVPPDQPLGQAELAAQRAHLVLEKLAQGLDQLQLQLQLHPLGQAAHIMMRLDGDRGAAEQRARFDDVGIERALRQELRASELMRLLVSGAFPMGRLIAAPVWLQTDVPPSSGSGGLHRPDSNVKSY